MPKMQIPMSWVWVGASLVALQCGCRHVSVLNVPDRTLKEASAPSDGSTGGLRYAGSNASQCFTGKGGPSDGPNAARSHFYHLNYPPDCGGRPAAPCPNSLWTNYGWPCGAEGRKADEAVLDAQPLPRAPMPMEVPLFPPAKEPSTSATNERPPGEINKAAPDDTPMNRPSVPSATENGPPNDAATGTETVELDESQPEGSDATSEPPPDGLSIPPNEIPLEWKQPSLDSAWNMPAPIIAHRGAAMIRPGSVPATTPRVAFLRLPELR